MSRIRVRHGDHEIELDGPDEFIKAQLADFYSRLKESVGRLPVSKIKQEILEPAPKPVGGKEPTPAEFYRQKGKEDGISQILILGKYLEEYRGISEFSRDDVNKLSKEVKLSKDIHGQYFTNAVKQGLLRSHGHGKYSLTLSAESTLSSM
ncbi:MAG: hypothetical protein GXY19_00560 [Phycisphaerae bacterium]|nr:hypothetical protein [Phycisphaerae bacterium]